MGDNPESPDLINKLEKLYKDDENQSYLNKYGSDVLFSILLILLALFAIIYLFVKNSLKSLKNQWVDIRCNPTYMPFAGIINPIDGISNTQATEDNFNYCLQSLEKDVTNEALQPAYYSMNVINTMYSEASKSVNGIRDITNNNNDKSDWIIHNI